MTSKRKPSSLDEREKLAKEINKIRKNIKRKHSALTQNIIDEEQHVEKSLKPIITPLNQLIEEKKKSDVIKEEKKLYDDIEMDDIQSRFKNKRSLEEPITHENESSLKRLQMNDSFEMQTTPPPLPYEEETYETLPTVRELLSTPEGRKEAKYFIDNWFKGLLVRRYMHMFFDDKNNQIDHVYGPNYNDNEVLMLGKLPITFDGDDIVIDNIKYTGTPGLYELIFMKRPDDYIFTADDLRTYSHILKATDVYTQFSTGRIKSSKGIKYNKIIKPFLSSIQDKGGRGLVKLTNVKPNYIYWNNVNELCERLQLLIASQNAGHSGHRNEILSIIEELHEAGIINEDASSVEAIFVK